MLDDMLPRECALELMDLARAGMPREVCGFVTDDWQVIHMTNVSANPHKGFAMDPDEMLDVLVSEARNVTGIWHSHPSNRGYPSEEDKNFFLIYPVMRHFIVTVMNVWEWRLTDAGVRPVKRDGSTGAEGMACPLLAPAEEVRR